MNLFYSPTSPYVRKVVVLLHESGQVADVTLTPAQGTPLKSSGMPTAQNPLGKVPALERPDGPALYDSRVICRYLSDRAKTSFYPDAPRLYDTLTLEATADGLLDAALLMVYENRLRPEDKQMTEIIEGQWSKVARACAAINARWMAHLEGPVDIGHIAVGCALGYLDFRHDARNWRQGNDALATWYKTFETRPAMVATVPADG